MPAQVLRSVAYTLSEMDMIAYDRLMRKRRARVVPTQRSWISAVFAPLALGTLLAAASLWTAGLGSAGFGYELVVGTVAYLAGFFALQYELSRSSRLAATAIFRANPLLHQPGQVTIRDDALAGASAGMSVQFRYAAFTEIEVTDGLILAWLGSTTAALFPIRAFANTTDAEAFAEELRSRIAAAPSAAPA
jgi:hypothetical protein